MYTSLQIQHADKLFQQNNQDLTLPPYEHSPRQPVAKILILILPLGLDHPQPYPTHILLHIIRDNVRVEVTDEGNEESEDLGRRKMTPFTLRRQK